MASWYMAAPLSQFIFSIAEKFIKMTFFEVKIGQLWMFSRTKLFRLLALCS